MELLKGKFPEYESYVYVCERFNYRIYIDYELCNFVVVTILPWWNDQVG